MLKKIISFILSAVLINSLMSTAVNAAAPLDYEGITTNVLDVDFGEAKSSSDVPELSFSGSWIYTGEFITMDGTKNGSVKTKNQIDLTDAYGYEFSSRTIVTQNAMIMYLAYDAASGSGYKVVLSKKNSKATLYRAGSEEAEQALTTESLSVEYGTPYVWSAKLEGNTLTISKNGTAVITYTDSETPGLKGIFGVESSAIENFAVINMKLNKLGNKVTVNDWRYEKTISEADTRESLANEGLTFTTKNTVTPTYSTSNGINFTSNPSTTNFYYDKKLSGDYSVIVSYYTNNGNATRVLFNGSSTNNAYAVVYDIKSSPKTYSIRKYTDGTGEIISTIPAGEEKATVNLSKSSTTVTHVMNFKDNSDGTITVTAKAYSSKTISDSNKTAEVSAVINKSDLYTPEYNKIRTYWNAPDKCKFYRFDAYSTPSGDTVSRDVDLVNKTFVTNDTVTSLKKQGIIVETTPTLIKTSKDKYLAYRDGGKDGMFWTGGNHVNVRFADEISGDYTFTVTTKAQQNATRFQINRTDDNNQYVVAVSKNGITISKTQDGETTISSSAPLTKADGITETTGNFAGYGFTTTINVTNDDNGNLKIKADVDVAKTGVISTCELIDETGTPHTSGLCRVRFDKNQGDYRMLYDMKITQHGVYTEDGQYTGRFYVDGQEVTSFTKGKVYFETPVVDLGTYEVVAALYEDNQMTEMKNFTAREIYEGKVMLFDTTNSTADASEIKVFFLDSGDTLNKTMNVWSLR